jgi:hypothetical protein
VVVKRCEDLLRTQAAVRLVKKGKDIGPDVGLVVHGEVAAAWDKVLTKLAADARKVCKRLVGQRPKVHADWQAALAAQNKARDELDHMRKYVDSAVLQDEAGTYRAEIARLESSLKDARNTTKDAMDTYLAIEMPLNGLPGWAGDIDNLRLKGLHRPIVGQQSTGGLNTIVTSIGPQLGRIASGDA